MASVIKGYEDLPRFPDGRIDYTNSQRAPIVVCVIMYGEKILLVKRSQIVSNHRDKWDVITGFIDNPNVSEIEHTVIELEEEIGIKVNNIGEIKIRDSYVYHDAESDKTLQVFPVLVVLKSEPSIELNEENTAFRWIYLKELEKYDAVPDLADAINAALVDGQATTQII